MYLSYSMKPNIVFVVGQLSKHNLNPQASHIKAAKKVVQYLKKTIHLGLVYGSQPQSKTLVKPSPFDLIDYGDSSYARDPKDMKSVMGYCYFFNEAIVVWSSIK